MIDVRQCDRMVANRVIRSWARRLGNAGVFGRPDVPSNTYVKVMSGKGFV